MPVEERGYNGIGQHSCVWEPWEAKSQAGASFVNLFGNITYAYILKCAQIAGIQLEEFSSTDQSHESRTLINIP